MPSSFNVGSGQDWDDVNVGRSTVARPKPKTNAGISSLKRAGLMTSEIRYVREEERNSNRD